MPSMTSRMLLVLSLLAAGPALANEPDSGQCSIELNYHDCRTCCEISQEIGEVLVSLCGAATRTSGALVGGWAGSITGGMIGDLVCEPMVQDATCYDRCIGKDGDPTPIICFDPIDPDELGVCRQVCEQGQHNIGSANCPVNTSIALTCCVNEYDPPDECPRDLCPGPLCPSGCVEVP
ncbi:MAG: hypothetical protein GTN89_08280 [Acidobacteria bacterium]|nr:hypothetical protein [Acidobacteriota bacterium]NIM63771.1 hypothetical protein [Acidobacteriota bacterium]NIO59340.1 hypothetical protein [Acidobacteriota bacterium]NIQ30354.1 hypothetical protein [Acidobacteriota bacterium]NIQ85291.1 hypothetical protein [Acidobacteriota bacterium]